MESQGLIYTKRKTKELQVTLYCPLTPNTLEGCWSAHPRCARAVSQLVVERQYRRTVSCSVIAWADCLVTGGVSGQYSVPCSSLVFLFV